MLLGWNKYERLINEFEDYQEKMSEKDFNDMVNQNIFPMFSHELKHSYDKKEYLKQVKGKDIFENVVLTNKFVNAEIREVYLKKIIGEKGYKDYHDIFISEVRADIFSYFDTNRQLLTHFKDCYNTNVVVKMVAFLVNKYTNENGEFSPMEEFNTFYNENTKGKELDIPVVEEEETDTFDALLNGEPIPIELYEVLKKIALLEIVTDDLEAAIKVFINVINSVKEETANQNL